MEDGKWNEPTDRKPTKTTKTAKKPQGRQKTTKTAKNHKVAKKPQRRQKTTKTAKNHKLAKKPQARQKTTKTAKNHKDGKKPQRRQKTTKTAKNHKVAKNHNRAPFAVFWACRGRNSSHLARSALRAQDAHQTWIDAPARGFWRLFPFLTRNALRRVPKTTSSPKNHKLAKKPQGRQKTTKTTKNHNRAPFAVLWAVRRRNSSHLARSALRARDAHSPLIYATSRGFSRF